MAKDNKHIEQIERYFNGQLTGSELKEFELELKRNPELTEEISAYDLALKGVEHYAIHKRLKHHHKSLLAKGKKARLTRNYLSGIAASLLLFVSIGYWFYFPKSDHESLFLQHFEPYEDIVNVRGGDGDRLQHGMKLYALGKYQKAITELDHFTISSDHYNEARFYKGISHLALGQNDKAIESLSKLAKSKFHQQAKWYLALSLLRNNDIPGAQSELSDIAPGEFQYDQAQQILSKLE